MLKLGILILLGSLYAAKVSERQCLTPSALFGGNICAFLIQGNGRTYSSAKHYCGTVYPGEIMTMDSDVKMAIVTNYLKARKIFGIAGISATRMNANGVKVWDSSDKPLVIDRSQGQSSTGLQCNAFNIDGPNAGTYWFAVPCTTRLEITVCEIPMKSTPPPPPPPVIAKAHDDSEKAFKCPKEYNRFGGNICGFLIEGTDWPYATAKYYCGTVYPGEIMTLGSDAKMAIVTKYIKARKAKGNAGISATRTNAKGVKVWDSNEKPLAIDRSRGQSIMGVQCNALNMDGPDAGSYWFAVPCTLRMDLFVCEFPMKSTSPPPPPPVIAKAPTKAKDDYDEDDEKANLCNGIFQEFEGLCLFATTVLRHYNTAEAMCKRLGGRLVSIQTQKKQDVVHKYVAQVYEEVKPWHKLKRWWLSGIKNIKGVYKWTASGDSVVFKNWMKKVTINPGYLNKQAITLNGGKWRKLWHHKHAAMQLCEADEN